MAGLKPCPVCRGMFLEIMTKVLRGIYSGNVSGITTHLEWESFFDDAFTLNIGLEYSTPTAASGAQLFYEKFIKGYFISFKKSLFGMWHIHTTIRTCLEMLDCWIKEETLGSSLFSVLRCCFILNS